MTTDMRSTEKATVRVDYFQGDGTSPATVVGQTSATVSDEALVALSRVGDHEFEVVALGPAGTTVLHTSGVANAAGRLVEAEETFVVSVDVEARVARITVVSVNPQ